MNRILKRAYQIGVLGIALALVFALMRIVFSQKSMNRVDIANSLLDAAIFLVWFGLISYGAFRIVGIIKSNLIVAASSLAIVFLTFEIMQIGFVLSHSQDWIDWERRVLLLAIACVTFEMSRSDRRRFTSNNC